MKKLIARIALTIVMVLPAALPLFNAVYNATSVIAAGIIEGLPEDGEIIKFQELKYPELKTTGVQYYVTNFPPGLRYSKGWYGTFEQCFEPQEVLLFDDDRGVCVFSLKPGQVLGKPQGGTEVKAVSLKEAESLIQSYTLEDSVKPIDVEIKQILPADAYFMGVWSGEKLKEKFDTPVELKPTTETVKDENTGEEKEITKEVVLTEKQIRAKALYEDAIANKEPFDLAKYDPDRFAVMGQVFVVNGTASVNVAGRNIADVTFNITDAGGGGNFTLYMASGTTATLSDGTCDVTFAGYPNLALGLNTITIAGTGTAAFDITIGTAANWSSVNSWSATSGGACTASVPTSADSTFMDANSFTGASQVLTVDATANCLNHTWTGATNTPTLAGASALQIYGNTTYIAAMVKTHAGNTYFYGTNATITTNALSLMGAQLIYAASGYIKLLDSFTTASILYVGRNTFDTNGQAITCTGFNSTSASAKTLTLGASVINCTSLDMVTGGGAVTLTVNTSTINVSGTGAFAGGTPTGSYYNINLNGTAHTVSGTFSFNILTRNGTATNANTVTFTSGTTITGVTMALIGNSRANQLLAQSSTLGTAATIHVDNFTGTNNVDLMDLTTTHAVDFQALGILTVGNAYGNTGFTFPDATADQDYTADAGGAFSTPANWSGGRIPLVGIDNIVITNAFNSGVTLTWDMPRCGKSIDFSGMSWAGTATVVSLSQDVETYGSSTLKTGGTFTTNSKIYYLRGRDSGMPVGGWVLTSSGNALYHVSLYAPLGTYKLGDNLTCSAFGVLRVQNGTFNANNKNTSGGYFWSTGTTTRSISMGSGTWTITRNGADTPGKWDITNPTGLTFNAETSTIVLSNISNTGNTFAGGGLSYNSVQVAGAGNYALTITGNNTFTGTFTVDRSVAAKTIIATGTTQTVANWSCPVSGVTDVTLTNGTWTKTGGSYISSVYLLISGSTATPVSTWYAGANSHDNGGNSGWIFSAPALSTVISLAATLISNIAATLNGQVTALGSDPSIANRGFVWDTVTRAAPGNVAPAASGYSTNWTEADAFPVGTFSHIIAITVTTYYFRACSNTGPGWSYGGELSVIMPLPLAPTNLILTQTMIDTYDADWTKDVNADTTYIRVKVDSYPVDITDGFLIYNGALATYSQTGLNFDQYSYNVRAWSHNPSGYSTNYADATIGGANMALLASNTGLLVLLGLFLLPLGLLIFATMTMGSLWAMMAGMFFVLTTWYSYTNSLVENDFYYICFIISSFLIAIAFILGAYIAMTDRRRKMQYSGGELLSDGELDEDLQNNDAMMSYHKERMGNKRYKKKKYNPLRWDKG
jgi:hypothetical protein